MTARRATEDLSHDHLSWWSILKAFGPSLWPHRRRLMMAIGCSLVAVAATVLSPWPLKFIIDHVLSQQPLPGLLETVAAQWSAEIKIVVLAGLVVVIAGLGAICSALEKNINARLREQMVLELRGRVLSHLQTLPLTLRTQHKSGELVLRIVNDVNQLVRMLTKAFPMVFRHLVTTLAVAAAMFWLDPWLGLLGLGTVLGLAALVHYYAGILQKASRLKRHREGEVAGLAQEIIRGLPSVQAQGIEESVKRRFLAVNATSLDAGVRETRVAVGMERTMQIVNGVAVALIVGGGGLLVFQGDLTLGGLTVCAAYITQLLKPVEKINQLASAVTRGMARGEQLLALLDLRPIVRDLPGAVPIGRANGRLEMRSVAFSYPPSRTDGSPKPVLLDLNLDLEPGTLNVLVGPSGGGKSTLLNLLLRLADPTDGEIRLDGTTYHKIQLRHLRAQFAVMLQVTHLFAGSLRAALQRIDSPVSDDELWQALASVALEDFARALPAGLDTPLAEESVNLSGGQRARIALARTLLLDRPILLLDEPFANVDAASQRIIMDALEGIRRQRTLLVVTHQPILTDQADVILRLENGRVTRMAERRTPVCDLRK